MRKSPHPAMFEGYAVSSKLPRYNSSAPVSILVIPSAAEEPAFRLHKMKSNRKPDQPVWFGHSCPTPLMLPWTRKGAASAVP